VRPKLAIETCLMLFSFFSRADSNGCKKEGMSGRYGCYFGPIASGNCIDEANRLLNLVIPASTQESLGLALI
jgi:hypothetical protein